MTSISNALQPKKTPASRKIKHKMKKKKSGNKTEVI